MHRYDTTKLKDQRVREQLKQNLSGKLKENEVGGEMECELLKLKNDILKPDKIKKKKIWMTSKILVMMEEQQKYNNTDSVRYNGLQKNIRGEIR